MKKILLFLISNFLILLTPAFGQNSTTVTGTAKDVNGIPYSNATVQAQLLPVGVTPRIPPPCNGQNASPCFAAAFSQGSTDVNGNFSMNLASNAALLPGGTQWQFTINESGVPAPLGTGPQTCSATLTISGASQSISSSFSTCPALSVVTGSGTVGSITTAWYASPNCLSGTGNCSFVNANTHWVCDATTVNTSNVITAPDGNFLVTAKVGEIVWAVNTTCNGAVGPLALPETTILSVDSPTQIHTTANAIVSSPANQASLFWGTLDTPTAGNCATGTDNLKNAVNSALAVGASLYLPTGGGQITTAGSGGIMVECAELQSPTSTTQTNPMNIIGQVNSYIIATPNFDFTSVPAGSTGALGTFSPTNSNIPNVSILRDISFMCGGLTSWGSGITTHPIIFAQRVVATNVTGWGCGFSGISVGFEVAGPSTVVAGMFNNFGATSCQSQNTGLNQAVVFTGTGYCSGPVGLTISGTGNWTASFGTFYQAFGGQAAINLIGTNQVFNSYGDIINPENNFNTIGVRNVGAGNKVLLDGSWVYSISETAAAFGMVFNAAGASTTARNSTIQGAGGVLISGGGVTGLFNDQEGNTYSGGSICASATCTLIADGHSAKGSCTGTATAASTLGLYPLGGSTTTCTSATPNAAPVVIAGARTLQNLTVTAGTGGVNASSGVFTVLRNGVATTITCTLGTGTSCVDNTHTVVAADGDLISIQFTTQAADTLANVKAMVEWN